tara:strand:- start:750 stop:1682 length:933 start_codon:yes stop_codon:yes gene_type:complete
MNQTNILDYIGNTPLVEISILSPNPEVRIFAKLEGQNPSGSIKDRIAKRMILEAEKAGLLSSGDTIIEASTGNTALALALIAKQRGYKLKSVVSTKTTPGMGEILISHDVDVIWCEPKTGMKSAIDLAKQLAKENGWFSPCQFENISNITAHYETTGPEILAALPTVDTFIAGIGTGGTLMGVGGFLRKHNPEIKVIGVEPKMGESLQGLRNLDEGYIPPLLDLNSLDGRFLVDSSNAFECAKDILRRTGISAGISAGATLYCAQRLAARMTDGNIVTIFADGGWKYLMSTPWRKAAASSLEDPDEIAWW